MQDIHAHLKNLRIAPRKVRLVASLLKNMDALTAEAHLKHLHQKSAASILKLLKSCIANAEHNNHLAKQDLYVKLIRVDAGQSLRRQSRTWHGMAYPLLKRSSHVTVVLSAKVGARQIQSEASKAANETGAKQRVRSQGEPKKTGRGVTRQAKAPQQGAGKTRLFQRKAI